MSTEPTSPPDPRSETFGYVCHGCFNCCRSNDIHVNPYEVARLARHRGQSTTAFRAASTRDGAGVLLARRDGGDCVFLGPEGCTVYDDRPLVCRLYPLGLQVFERAPEKFVQVEPHPQTAGEYTRNGTIAGFLEAHDAGPYLRAVKDYFGWLCAARKFNGAPPRKWADWLKDAAFVGDLVDMDIAIARHCAASGEAEPTDIEDRRRLHLDILYRQIAPPAEDGRGAPDSKD